MEIIDYFCVDYAKKIFELYDKYLDNSHYVIESEIIRIMFKRIIGCSKLNINGIKKCNNLEEKYKYFKDKFKNHLEIVKSHFYNIFVKHMNKTRSKEYFHEFLNDISVLNIFELNLYKSFNAKLINNDISLYDLVDKLYNNEPFDKLDMDGKYNK